MSPRRRRWATTDGPVILELLLALWMFAHGAEPGDDPPPADGADAPAADPDALERYRLAFPDLIERTIGTAARPVVYDWRRSNFQIAATGSHLFELNNFNSYGAGVRFRRPSKKVLFEAGLDYVWVRDTPSSTLLALTPYRQPGRPSRFQGQLNVGVPFAEGVVTARPKFLPATQLVFNGYAGVQYVAYPGGFRDLTFREWRRAMLSTRLTEPELDNLDDRRLDAMVIDPSRFSLLVGLGNDLYFEGGLFVSPRVLVAVPTLRLADAAGLRFWGQFDLAVGIAR
jgi:hypothetical protein